MAGAALCFHWVLLRAVKERGMRKMHPRQWTKHCPPPLESRFLHKANNGRLQACTLAEGEGKHGTLSSTVEF